MMKISNVLDDWFLGKRETEMLILEEKTVILLPKNSNLSPNTFIYANGLALKVESVMRTTLNEIIKNYDYELPKKLGIKSYKMSATCEYPEYILYSHCDQKKGFEYFFDAVRDYIVDTLGYTAEEELVFYNIKLYNISQYYEKYNNAIIGRRRRYT